MRGKHPEKPDRHKRLKSVASASGLLIKLLATSQSFNIKCKALFKEISG
jgi:hypothetical protein